MPPERVPRYLVSVAIFHGSKSMINMISIGGTNHQLDLQNPDNLGRTSTDAGYVPNLKWSFSDSKTNIFPGGWSREQIISDLPLSTDIAGAQQHLKKGAIRELHWHRTVSDDSFVPAIYAHH